VLRRRALRGRLKLDELVAQTYPLKQVNDAFRRWHLGCAQRVGDRMREEGS
jgi:Zn-dependent alcohol dehydrogenase